MVIPGGMKSIANPLAACCRCSPGPDCGLPLPHHSQLWLKALETSSALRVRQHCYSDPGIRNKIRSRVHGLEAFALAVCSAAFLLVLQVLPIFLQGCFICYKGTYFIPRHVSCGERT